MSDVDCVAVWINHASLKLRPKSLQAYRWEIDRLRAHYFDRDLLSLTTTDLEAYLAHRNCNGAGAASIYRACNAYRHFFGYYLGNNSPAHAIDLKRPPDRIQRTLTKDEADRLIYSQDTSTIIGRRNLAICAVMLDSGLRAAEICRLAIDQIDLAACLVWTEVKGGQEEFGAISPETANFLSAWLASRAAVARCDKVFVNLKAQRRGLPLTPDGLRCIMHEIGKDLGIKGLSPHVLRRSYATITSLMGAPARAAQEGGRWKRLEEYERYTKAINLDAVRPFLPVSGIMRGA